MKSSQSSPKTSAADESFTAEERAALKERAKEVQSAKRGARGAKADPEAEVLAKIAEMQDADRALAEQVHRIIRASAPHLTPKLWYGMPAYAKNGKVLCHFQSAAKFKTQYATLGFSDQAELADGAVWPVAYALTALGPADEERIAALVKQAAG
ncbi:iron chaperone [Streptomyces sp. NPDC088387]|uniref:iron chaperone n=1 Tax=Streptomyces sp. NPDC088387 TaxID=3365859 RepID=UPI003819A168